MCNISVRKMDAAERFCARSSYLVNTTIGNASVTRDMRVSSAISYFRLQRVAILRHAASQELEWMVVSTVWPVRADSWAVYASAERISPTQMTSGLKRSAGCP